MRKNKTKKMKKMKGGDMFGSMMGGPMMSSGIPQIIQTVSTEIIKLATEIGNIGKNITKEGIDLQNQSAKELIDIAKKAAMEIITHSKSTIQSTIPVPATPAITPSTTPNTQTGGKHKGHKSHKRHKRS